MHEGSNDQVRRMEVPSAGLIDKKLCFGVKTGVKTPKTQILEFGCQISSQINTPE
jgi:hypothetical protein